MRHLLTPAVVVIALAASSAVGQVEGVVTGVDGEPAADVVVLLVEVGDRPGVINGRLGYLGGADLAATGPDGRFRFDLAPAGPYRLVSLGDDGYAESDVARPAAPTPALALVAWATIEVTASAGGEPAPGAEVGGGAVRPLIEDHGIEPGVFHWLDGNAGEDGRYAFGRVRPGGWTLYQDVPLTPGGRTTGSHPVRVEAVAGETTFVTIGGEGGRDVTGRIDLPADLDPPATPVLAFLTNDWSTPGLTPPATYGEVEAMPQAEREAIAATDAFAEYAAALDADLARRQSYVLTVGPDGAFVAANVPPGEYDVFVVLRQPGDGGAELEVEQSVVVPEGDGPHDLGVLDARPVVSLAVGDPVPDVAFEDVDGNEHRLSDFRGRVVLLDAWATWCGPCVGETLNILAVQEEFGDRIAIVGLSMDDDPEAPRRYAQRKGLTWTNGFIGQEETTDVDDQLGIGGIPDIRLIGPDGRLLAAGLRGDEIREAVAEALGE